MESIPVFILDGDVERGAYEADVKLEENCSNENVDTGRRQEQTRVTPSKKIKKRGGPVTTKRGQYHKHRSLKFVLVKDPTLMKIDINVRKKNRDTFIKKEIKLEKRNANPDYLRNVILGNFPELYEFANVFSLWHMRMNTYDLIPLAGSVNNAKALCSSDELNRSCVYVKPCRLTQSLSSSRTAGDVTMPAADASATQFPQPNGGIIGQIATTSSNSKSETSLMDDVQYDNAAAPPSVDMTHSVIPSSVVQLMDVSSPLSGLLNSVISGYDNTTHFDQPLSTPYISAPVVHSSSASYSCNSFAQQSTEWQFPTLAAFPSQASFHYSNRGEDGQGSWTPVVSSNNTYIDSNSLDMARLISASGDDQSASHINTTNVQSTPHVNVSGETSINSDFDIAICPLCRKFLFEPKTLPCQDSFCLQCLENIEQSGAWIVHGPFCPECRLPFDSQHNGVKSLATNSFIERIVRRRRLDNHDDFDRACETCFSSTTGDGAVPDAVGYCIECQQKLCCDCYNSHQKIRTTKMHVVMPLGVSTVDGFPDLMEKNNSLHFCSTCYRPASLCCATCSQLLCSECLVPHTNHELETINDAVGKYRGKLADCSNKLNLGLDHLIGLERQLEDGKLCYENVEKEIRQKVADLKNLLDMHASELLEQLKNKTIQMTKVKEDQRLPSAKPMSKALIVARELLGKGSDYDLLLFSQSVVDFADTFLQDNTVEDAETAVPLIRFIPSAVLGKLIEDSVNFVGCLFPENLSPNLNSFGSHEASSITHQGTADAKQRLKELRPLCKKHLLVDSLWCHIILKLGSVYLASCADELQATLKQNDQRCVIDIEEQRPQQTTAEFTAGKLSGAVVKRIPTSSQVQRTTANSNTGNSSAAASSQVEQTTAKQNAVSHVISSDERGAVVGVAIYSDKLFVLRERSKGRIEQFDVKTFQEKKFIKVNGLSDDGGLWWYNVNGWCYKSMTSCDINSCLYISDCYKVFRVNPSTEDVISWSVDGLPCGLSVNETRNVLVTCWSDDTIKEYTTRGSFVRSIKLQVNHVKNPCHCIQLTDSRYVVCHWSPVNGVSEIDKHGTLIATYRNSKTTKLKMKWPRCVILFNDSLLVADTLNDRILLLNTSLRDARPLSLPVNSQLSGPCCMYLEQSRGRLFVGEESGRVLVIDNIDLK